MNHTRITAIIRNKGKILLVHRKNHGKEYYALPRYRIEHIGSIEKQLQKKIKDHIMIDTVVRDCLQDYFYLCTYICGKPEFSQKSTEVLTMKVADQYFKPLWVSLSRLQKIPLYPKLYTPLFDKKSKTLYGMV